MENVLNAGALGVEIIISGKIPGARAKNWRFYLGYLKKCGDIAVVGVRKAKKSALLKSGIIGVKVAIMPADLVLPDKIELLSEPQQIVEEVPAEKEKPKKKTTAVKKKAPKKKIAKKEAVVAVVEEAVSAQENSAQENQEEAKSEESTEVKEE